MSEKRECSEILWRGWGGRQGCSKPATVERDGKHYCSTHDPVRIAAKRAARDAKRIAKADAFLATRREQLARERHRDHCEAVQAEMLEALKLARDGMEASGGWEGDDAVFSIIVAAIAKAEGGGK